VALVFKQWFPVLRMMEAMFLTLASNQIPKAWRGKQKWKM
jgi:hypothetical protein